MEPKTCNIKSQQQIFNLHLNQSASCCRAYPDPLDPGGSIIERQKVWSIEKQQLDQGIEIPNCRVCWVDENNGVVSFRQQYAQQTFPRLELFLDNVCNHMCSYCSPKYSSIWEDCITQQGIFQKVSKPVNENLKITKQDKSTSSHWFEQITQYLENGLTEAIDLVLLGGEPLMQRRSLESLLKLSNEKIRFLIITTNLNPPSNKFLLWLLDNVDNSKLRFNISMDASLEYNHIPRFGFNQELFLENLKLLESKNIKFSFLNTVSALSIFDAPKFHRWSQQYDVEYNRINNPTCLNPDVVPFLFRNKILQQLNDTVPEILLKTLELPDAINIDLKMFEQYNYLTQYFNRTNTNPTTTSNALWNEYWTWLESKYK